MREKTITVNLNLKIKLPLTYLDIVYLEENLGKDVDISTNICEILEDYTNMCYREHIVSISKKETKRLKKIFDFLSNIS